MKYKNKAVLALLSAVLLTGCQTQQDKPAEEPIEEKESKYSVVIGEKSDDTQEILLKNETGNAVTSIKMGKEADLEKADNLLKDGQWKDKDTLQWWAAKKDLDTATDIEITLDDKDKTVLTIKNVKPGDLNGNASLKLKDGKGFFEYKDKDGKTLTTAIEEKKDTSKEEEPDKEEPAQEEAPAPEEAAQEPVYSEPVVQEPVYEEPVYQEPVYQEPVYNEPVYQEPAYQEPAYQEPAVDAGTQGTDSCLGGAGGPAVNPDY